MALRLRPHRVTPPLVECVPNFSDGRSTETLSALERAIVSVPGVALLDVHADAWHHRSVFTFVAEPRSAGEAAFRAVQVAAERIDLTQHRGEHPRIGAADVVPFVPVGDTTMEVCVATARGLGERVGRELAIPVYLYGRAATSSAGRRLAEIRQGGFEALRVAIERDPSRRADFGPNAVHPTAGATSIGARPFLVAYNVYLDTDDVAVARAVASRVRASSGGLPAVEALGFRVRGRAQVSMNLLDIDTTTPALAYAAVTREAAGLGVGVAGSEFVGLVPERAVRGVDAAALGLNQPLQAHLFEPRLREALRTG